MFLVVLSLQLAAAGTAQGAKDQPFGGLFKEQCAKFEPYPALAGRQLLQTEFGSRATRMSHFAWSALPLAVADLRDDELKLLKSVTPEWFPPSDSSLGADLLLYNHERIRELFEVFHSRNVPCSKAWSLPPESDQAPLMPSGYNSSLYLLLKPAIAKLHDRAWLKDKSLREVGDHLRLELLPLLRKAYSGDAPPNYHECALNVDELMVGSFAPNKCTDKTNSWFGGGAAEQVSPLYPVELALSEQALTSWMLAHGLAVSEDSLRKILQESIARKPWTGGASFEQDVSAGIKNLVAKRMNSTGASEPTVRADLRMRLEHIVRVLNKFQAFEK